MLFTIIQGHQLRYQLKACIITTVSVSAVLRESNSQNNPLSFEMYSCLCWQRSAYRPRAYSGNLRCATVHLETYTGGAETALAEYCLLLANNRSVQLAVYTQQPVSSRTNTTLIYGCSLLLSISSLPVLTFLRFLLVITGALLAARNAIGRLRRRQQQIGNADIDPDWVVIFAAASSVET